ncbi:MAG: hypothetical protein ACFB9N_11050 [Geitlerinemataceae cyanobacterium]
MTLQEVERAVARLSPEELAAFRAWFVAFDRASRPAEGLMPLKALAGICSDDPIVIDDAGISDDLDDWGQPLDGE